MIRIRLGSPAALELALSAALLLATLPARGDDDAIHGANENDLIAGNSILNEARAA
ncbi:MAG: hypothetical protein ABJC13_02770 [Acidobacteriota bacterium]